MCVDRSDDIKTSRMKEVGIGDAAAEETHSGLIVTLTTSMLEDAIRGLAHKGLTIALPLTRDNEVSTLKERIEMKKREVEFDAGRELGMKETSQGIAQTARSTIARKRSIGSEVQQVLKSLVKATHHSLVSALLWSKDIGSTLWTREGILHITGYKKFTVMKIRFERRYIDRSNL